ncbi:MAG TPA: glycosyltransferase family 2 protein [Bryobacteraceae bacterium]|nr:glycosyltransferase family 2 protein [Bryobacteraceae bacterium]
MNAGEPNTLQVSVIVPTRNRMTLLRELVESLWKQTLAPHHFEIIVVDNCSSDQTAEVMAEMANQSPCPLRYVRNEQNLGQIYSRNAGARHARAEILAFTDSDCRVSPQWLETSLAAFSDHGHIDPEQIGFVSGPVRDKPEQPVTFFSLPTFANNGENVTYPACNILYRKSAFWKAGGFDESAWPGDVGDKSFGDSDTELAWKVKNLGFENIFMSDAVVYHQVWSLTLRQWLKAQILAWRIPGVLQRTPELKPKLLWWGPFLFRDNLLFYLAAIGAALAAAGFAMGIPALYWALVLALPHLWRTAYTPGRPAALLKIHRVAGRMFFLTLRQGLICGALVAGSIRSRTVAL